jgi:glutathione peroxidase
VSIFDVPIGALDGGPANLRQYRGKALLIVNVASKCGLTPQYASLQRLYETYAGRGLVVVGVPCNQFGLQEPGTAVQIRDFCETNFGITFPITEKVEVNGPGRHELFGQLTAMPDADGVAGDVRWNFEKFLICPDGAVAARFRPLTDPLAPELVAAVEIHLPVAPPPTQVAPVFPAPPVAPSWPDLAEARWPSVPPEPGDPAPAGADAAAAADTVSPAPPVPRAAPAMPVEDAPGGAAPARPGRAPWRWRRTWSGQPRRPTPSA